MIRKSTSLFQWSVPDPEGGRSSSTGDPVVCQSYQSPTVWQDALVLISSQNGNISKTAIVIHSKKPRPESKTKTLKGQRQSETWQRPRWEIPKNGEVLGGSQSPSLLTARNTQ